MKQILILLSALSGFPAVTVCAGDANVIELIADPNFTWGLRAEDRQGKERLITWNTGTHKPVWHVFQHDTKSCVADAAFHAFPPGGFSFRDDYVWLAIHPQAPEADVVVGMNALHEYGGVPRALLAALAALLAAD
jgi:hypothetical protein